MSLLALTGALFLKPAAVILAATALTAALRHATAAARHAVWAGAIGALLALPILSFTLPPLRIETPYIGPTVPVAGNDPRGAISVATKTSDRDWSIDRTVIDRLPTALRFLWIAGVLLLVVRRIGAEVRVRRIARRARPFHSDARVTDEIPAPVVAGVFRPVILFPAAAATWAADDFNAALAHEQAHVSRGDGLVNLCGDIAKAIYWCNPLVHLAVRRMRAESEVACDDRVLLRGTDPERYAQLLLAIARRARGLPRAAIAMARPRELESRLLTVLDPAVRRAPLRPWMPPALAAVGLLIALPTAALTLQAALLGEPDRRGDALASPASERIALEIAPDQIRLAAAAALSGPDSMLARILIAGLDHRPDGPADLVRERAAWALAQARGGLLVEPLLAALDSRDWRVQSYAAWTLAIAREPRAVSRLIALLGHRVWRLRAMAAAALHASGDLRAQAAMEAALLDPAWQVRLEAVQYFGALGGPRLDSRLRPLLDDRHIAVRLAARAALPH